MGRRNRRTPVRESVENGMAEVQMAAVEARELLAQLRGDGIDLTVHLPILGEQTIHIQLAQPEPEPE